MKILLVADIGGFPKNYRHFAYPKYYYHVGDEAMFFNTVDWYKKNYKNSRLTAFTWKNRYKELRIKTINHFAWPTKPIVNRLNVLVLLGKSAFYRYLRINLLSKEEKRLMAAILSSDTIHFTGGGNISSLYPSWLYYVFFIIGVASLFQKKIILTSQTIGPFKTIDKLLSSFILQLPKIVAVREPKNLYIKNKGINSPNFRYMLDVAYTSSQKSPITVPKKTKKIRVGVSVHAWENFTAEKVSELIIRIITEIDKKFDCEYIFIPHIISEDKNKWDLALTSEVAKKIRSKKIFNMPFDNYIGFGNKNASYIKALTASTDLLITTRYHGLIFALSSSVPAVALSYDQYYHMKNQGALAHIYGMSSKKYEVLIDKNEKVFDLAMKKINNLLDNLSKEKKLLQKLNKKALGNVNLFSLNKLKNMI